MGASSWSYFVPYQADLNAALHTLRERVFAERDYYWVHDGAFAPGDPKPWPTTMDELYSDELVQEGGTHSIIDMVRVTAPGERPDYFTVQPVSAREARKLAKTDKPTRADVDVLEPLASQRWFGRCVILHDEHGKPAEIYFWGSSGD